MKKKLVSIAMALTLAVSALVGCGSQAGSGAASTGAAAQESSAAVSASETASSAESTAAAASESSQAASTEQAAASEAVTAADAAGTEELGSGAVRVATLKGPTAMGLVKFMDEADSGALSDGQYQFTMYDAPDQLVPLVVKGDVDIAMVPGNLASVLYQKTKGNVQVFAINTLGVLYIVDNGNPVSSVADLKGRSIAASGMGSTPQYVLNYILQQNGLDPEKDVDVTWCDDHSMALQMLMKDNSLLAMLPQPFVTVAQTKADTIHVDLDLTEEWNKTQEKAQNPSQLVMGVAIVNKAFAEKNPEALRAFMSHYEESVKFVNSNVDEAAALVGKYDIVPEGVAKKAIPACNITYIAGEDMKNGLSGFLQVLNDQDPSAVGGALPEDDFYYTAE
ncbi:MAG: ABC transporter substrate-binding protein [Lachnospiraceae bacterium]|nr:ABC transporter substrate-binding protein [Lachnospiraceae bacterium]